MIYVIGLGVGPITGTALKALTGSLLPYLAIPVKTEGRRIIIVLLS